MNCFYCGVEVREYSDTQYNIDHANSRSSYCKKAPKENDESRWHVTNNYILASGTIWI